jgi:thiamine-phosphate pyrophosphorylase
LAGAKSLDLAVLLSGQVHTAASAGASGVYLSDHDGSVANARMLLGPDAIIGCACGISRHLAMEGAEAGAEFVTFAAASTEDLEAAMELSEWWDSITGVPCALVTGRMCPPKTVLSKARPDFLLLEEVQRAGESLTFATEFGLQSQT